VVEIRFVLRKILSLPNVKWKTNFNNLSVAAELSVLTCQRIVRKDLDDSVTAERYGNNILEVFINQFLGISNKTGLTARKTLRYLWKFFDDRLINRNLWPAHTPLDYYPLLHLKKHYIQGTCPHN
jgi:hypothetical protein